MKIPRRASWHLPRPYLTWSLWRIRRQLQKRAPVYRMATAPLRDHGGHQTKACLWTDGALSIEGVLGPPTSVDGAVYPYTFLIGGRAVPKVIAALGGPPHADPLAMIWASRDEILDHGHLEFAAALELESWGESAFGRGGPGAWFTDQGIFYCFSNFPLAGSR